MLYLIERQHDDVGKIGKEVKPNDDQGSESERERHIPRGIPDFTGGEGDVVPGICCIQSARFAQCKARRTFRMR